MMTLLKSNKSLLYKYLKIKYIINAKYQSTIFYLEEKL